MTENTKKKSLSAQEYPVNKIFCDDYVLEIPSYQRPYSWTTEQASELVMDLQDYIKVTVSDILLQICHQNRSELALKEPCGAFL